jgi:two-component system response regulator (stage 0 sporulation protein A)
MDKTEIKALLIGDDIDDCNAAGRYLKQENVRVIGIARNETDAMKLLASQVRRRGETVEARKAGADGLMLDVTDTLREVGMPAHVRGYHYIREAIVMTVDHMKPLTSITKELYPAVAKVYNTTPSRVERAIRHAIEITWARGADKNAFRYIKNKPTNAEFIAVIADKIQVDAACKRAPHAR